MPDDSAFKDYIRYSKMSSDSPDVIIQFSTCISENESIYRNIRTKGTCNDTP